MYYNHMIGFFLLVTSITGISAGKKIPELQLANRYHDQIDVANYWVSEKFDGVRGYWDGTQMKSRQGNIIQTPLWFVDTLPKTPLDGELWLGRGQFDRLSGIIRRHHIDEEDWRLVKYLIFDLPASEQTFDLRVEKIKLIVKQVNRSHIQSVVQFKLDDHVVLLETLDRIVKNKGEGLMLHRGASHYQNNRSDDLLKLKKSSDAEATVIEHYGGKGKYTGLLGSMLVETDDQRRFKLGTGFSDLERANPPPIGSIITYRYFGLTQKGTPRFASFLRIRHPY
ncbi:MAG: DNA ligase-1 [Chitinophagales bacterium]